MEKYSLEYGHAQAIIQLSIANNIGIYALKDISIPYLIGKRKELASLRELIGEKQEAVKLIEDYDVRNNKEKQLDELTRRLLDVWKKSSNLRDGYNTFIERIVVGSGVMALTGLALLFHSAYYYGDRIDDRILLLIYILYLPLAVMV